VDSIRSPEIVIAVKVKENEEAKEEAGDTEDVGANQEACGGWNRGVVYIVLVDTDQENYAGDDIEDVVDDDLLGDGEMKGRGAGGG